MSVGTSLSAPLISPQPSKPPQCLVESGYGLNWMPDCRIVECGQKNNKHKQSDSIPDSFGFNFAIIFNTTRVTGRWTIMNMQLCQAKLRPLNFHVLCCHVAMTIINGFRFEWATPSISQQRQVAVMRVISCWPATSEGWQKLLHFPCLCNRYTSKLHDR